ncbi:prepilin type IV pili [Caballeronia sp. LjRoot34]|uniref:type 4 pilus major pilin n=1 Tax=Caballeronia sp. LjRoot34 TaxID=3342325 RepID=UPI003ED0CE2F
MDGILGRIVAIVLGLLALSGVSYAAYKGFSGSKASQLSGDIAQIITQARVQSAQGSDGYTSFTTGNEGALITAGIFPGDMVRNGTVVDPWGNNVALTSDGNATEGVLTVGGGGSETADQCTNVVTGLKDYVSLAVGGTTFTQATPPDSVSAANACAAGLSITVTFQ